MGVKLTDYRGARATWCPGCGHFAVLGCIQQACFQLGIPPEKLCLVSGIGCSGKISQHFGGYGFHSLHGRALPVAVGVQLANEDLTVLAASGDGDGYGIGLQHTLHTMRRNVNMTYIVLDNHIYSLTTGQTSPTSRQGFVSKTSPRGSAEIHLRPLELALSAGASFIAQGFSGNVKQLTELIKKGVTHQGFSHINVFSPCVTFNRVNTFEWFKERITDLEEHKDYDPSDRVQAFQKVVETDSVLTGVIFQEDRPVYHKALPGGLEGPLSALDPTLRAEQFDQLVQEFH